MQISANSTVSFLSQSSMKNNNNPIFDFRKFASVPIKFSNLSFGIKLCRIVCQCLNKYFSIEYFSARSLCLKDKSVLVVNESSGSGHQLEIFTIAKKGKPIKAKKSLNISDESGESIEIFAARFGDEKADVVYGVDSNLVWEEIAIEGHENLERTVCQTSKNRKGSKSAKTDVEEVKPSKRATAENTTRRKRGESINETDMSMAERLGKIT